MEDFANEALEIQFNGLAYHDKVLKMKIFGFSCDESANSLMKSFKIHTGYNNCPKCEVNGKWAGRVVLLETSAPLRADENFRNN